jgi:hypothetical protein
MDVTHMGAAGKGRDIVGTAIGDTEAAGRLAGTAVLAIASEGLGRGVKGLNGEVATAAKKTKDVLL